MRKYNEEMDKMQQEAVRRMQEMQSRGKPVQPYRQENHEQSNPKEPPEKPVTIHNESDNNIDKVNSCSNNADKQPSFFESIFHDKERSLILLLLLLLSTEKTDTSLILALVYLLI